MKEKFYDVVIQLEQKGNLWRCGIYVDGELTKHSTPTQDKTRAERDFDIAKSIAAALAGRMN